MGFGPAVLELYRQLRNVGVLDNVSTVVELGSQDYWCTHANLIRSLLSAFGKDVAFYDNFLAARDNQKPARLLYEGLGLNYNCIDVDGRSDSIVLDLNFDQIPEDHCNRYGLVTNFGTTEHLLNQLNAFKATHDLAEVGGIMLHGVPFMGYLDHGFFSYHPNFFYSLAKYNSYEIVGLWIGLKAGIPQYVPWDISILDALALTPHSTFLIVAALRKVADAPFCAPFQGVYEDLVPNDSLARYAMVVDGEILDANRVRRLTRAGAVVEAWQSLPPSHSSDQPSGSVLSCHPALRETSGFSLLKELAFRVRRRLRL